LDRAEDFGRAGERTVVGDANEGLKLAYLHISTIQIGTIYDMLLCDTESNVILITAYFPNSQELLKHWFCRRANHPPVGPFVFLGT
jgi:hypothetical protein